MTARDPDARRYVREATAATPQAATVRVLASLLFTALRPDSAYRLPVPTLIVHGQYDRVGDIAAGARRWIRRDPRAELAVVPAAAHLSNLDAPRAFTAAVSEFLERMLPAPA